ncbi:MAG TPA: O-antigen ligase family protein [Bryobacteraceae bacterium]|nr:O-antigen ligase family protein [Bryobacteraceae bacterium]
MTLFLAAAGTTLTIGLREPFVSYAFEIVVFLLAASWCFARGNPMPLVPAGALAGISSWGFGQLALGATVYRHATLQTSLRYAALGATAWTAFRIFSSVSAHLAFLKVFAWFGAAVGVISVAAYFTSPGKMFWLFDAAYPDVWGCFPSRNNFAQFLELSMPVALWLGLREGRGPYVWLAAAMVASGIASASRAGACILVLEAAIVLLGHRNLPSLRRSALEFVLAVVVFAAIPGMGILAGRLAAPNPFEARREIAQSTLRMIESRPWAGLGLGAFAVVYPEFATFDSGRTVDHAHDDWLEWSAEGGVLFAGFWLVLAAQSARPAWRTGWGTGVAGCFLHATVDYPFARFGISAWAFILIGMLAATSLREVPHPRH